MDSLTILFEKFKYDFMFLPFYRFILFYLFYSNLPYCSVTFMLKAVPICSV
jgi:hypothetical protein